MSYGILSNEVFLSGIIGWTIAQAIKVPYKYIRQKQWDWSLLLRSGGMPSSHSALVAGVAHAAGLFAGFDSPVFGIALALAMIVIYDATGIRRQAGKHAKIINTMIDDLATGHPLKGEELLEVLGHSPLEALVGTLLGIAAAQILWFIHH